MRLNRLVIILIGTVIPAADAGMAASKNYPVSEVVRVLSPISFECRLQDYKPAPSVRFRVVLA
jgi:hypothetical protein